MTTPWQRYQADLQREDFSHDPAQEHAVELLQDLYERLLARHREQPGGLVGWWRNKLLRVFLVFILTGIGSAIGTYVGGYEIIKTLMS